MTLTEEQRDAIRAISKLPMAIGCQLCHPYIMKNYGSHFIVLRAMIDGSSMVGFDLEKNRAAIDSAINSLLCEGWDNEASTVRRLVAEIERLRASLVEHEEHENQTHEVLGNVLGTDDTLENVAKRAAARIKELEEAKPRVWQITEDRVTAIDQGLRFLEWSNAKNGSVETKKHIATLQTMLEETGDKNGFEGRNKMRIETIR